MLAHAEMWPRGERAHAARWADGRGPIVGIGGSPDLNPMSQAQGQRRMDRPPVRTIHDLSLASAKAVDELHGPPNRGPRGLDVESARCPCPGGRKASGTRCPTPRWRAGSGSRRRNSVWLALKACCSESGAKKKAAGATRRRLPSQKATSDHYWMVTVTRRFCGSRTPSGVGTSKLDSPTPRPDKRPVAQAPFSRASRTLVTRRSESF